MTGRTRAVVITILAAGLLIVAAGPAAAPYHRGAANAFNVTEACPSYLSVAVGRQDPMATGPQNVTIQAYALQPLGPPKLVLSRDVRVRPIEKVELLPEEEGEFFQLHGRAVMPWNTGRLAPGTNILVGTPELFEPNPPAQPQPFTISQRCDPPNLRLTSSCSATGGPHTWRVRNPESLPVEFNAEVLGTRPAELHVGTVPANNGVAEFTTQVPGPDVVVLFVGGIPVDVGVCLK
jgi:hypothetical protein